MFIQKKRVLFFLRIFFPISIVIALCIINYNTIIYEYNSTKALGENPQILMEESFRLPIHLISLFQIIDFDTYYFLLINFAFCLYFFIFINFFSFPLLNTLSFILLLASQVHGNIFLNLLNSLMLCLSLHLSALIYKRQNLALLILCTFIWKMFDPCFILIPIILLHSVFIKKNHMAILYFCIFIILSVSLNIGYDYLTALKMIIRFDDKYAFLYLFYNLQNPFVFIIWLSYFTIMIHFYGNEKVYSDSSVFNIYLLFPIILFNNNLLWIPSVLVINIIKENINLFNKKYFTGIITQCDTIKARCLSLGIILCLLCTLLFLISFYNHEIKSKINIKMNKLIDIFSNAYIYANSDIVDLRTLNFENRKYIVLSKLNNNLYIQNDNQMIDIYESTPNSKDKSIFITRSYELYKALKKDNNFVQILVLNDSRIFISKALAEAYYSEINSLLKEMDLGCYIKNVGFVAKN